MLVTFVGGPLDGKTRGLGDWENVYWHVVNVEDVDLLKVMGDSPRIVKPKVEYGKYIRRDAETVTGAVYFDWGGWSSSRIG